MNLSMAKAEYSLHLIAKNWNQSTHWDVEEVYGISSVGFSLLDEEAFHAIVDFHLSDE